MESERYSLRERTPESQKCGVGACPSIYSVELTSEKDRCPPFGACPGIHQLKRLTPKEAQGCFGGVGCPEIYAQNEDNYLIIGKKITREQAKEIRIDEKRTLADKIGDDEELISVPKAIIDNMLR